MTNAALTSLRQARGRIGPIGTATRIAGGLAAIVVPVALSGITWWDVGAALMALPSMAVIVVAAVDAAHRRDRADRPRSPQAESWIRNSVAVVLVLGIATAVTFITPVDGTAIWALIGLSLLIGAVRGDAASEVIAIPNALAGGWIRPAALSTHRSTPPSRLRTEVP
jgi:hypothetical protein